MVNRVKQIKHTFDATRDPQLMELVRYAHSGLAYPEARAFIESNGPSAARELLRYLTDLPAMAHCTSTEQFVLGHTLNVDNPKNAAALEPWESVLAEAFSLAQVADLDDLKDGPHEFVARVFPLMERAAAIASPRLLAWGVLSKN